MALPSTASSGTAPLARSTALICAGSALPAARKSVTFTGTDLSEIGITLPPSGAALQSTETALLTTGKTLS
jgi:hypothetical protein